MSTYYLPYAMHIPKTNANGSIATGTDGSGASVNGNQRPLLDTLIGLYNSTSSTQNVRFRFYDQAGSAVLWGDGLAYRDYSLGSKRAVATTLIPDNIFADPPQNFRGYGTIEISADIPVYGLIGGGGFYPDHWNIVSANLPVYRDLESATAWRFGYLIPYFQDANHANDRSYRTELVITNFDVAQVTFWVTFTGGDFYGTAGTQWVMKFTIPAGQSRNYDIYDELVSQASYTAGLNNEGGLLVEARTSTAASATLVSTKSAPYLIHWNRDKTLFSGGQGFWQ